MAKNLTVPKARGMTTTLVTNKPGRLDHREALDQENSDAATSRISLPTILENSSPA